MNWAAAGVVGMGGRRWNMAKLMPDRYGSRELKPREYAIIELVAQGLTNREIGRKIGRTEPGTKNVLRVIYDKLGLDSRLQLALWWEAHHGPYRIEIIEKQCQQNAAAPAAAAASATASIPVPRSKPEMPSISR
jgi:DNA-binding CsgD family transcriptional regulator